jgi:iron complex outermembrane receptor protein
VQTSIRPGLLEITNAASATIRGIEFEGASRLGGGWDMGGHVALLAATYDQYLAVNADGSTIDVAGHRLSNAPEWAGRVWLGHSGRIGRLELLSRVEWLHQSTVFFTPVNDALQQQRPYGLVTANLTVRPSSWWSVGVFGRNLTATDYVTGTNSAPPPAVGARPGEPRQMGVQLTLNR